MTPQVLPVSQRRGKAKLVQIDLNSNKLKRVYSLGLFVVPEDGFINDVRVSDDFALLPDSSLEASIVLKLDTVKG